MGLTLLQPSPLPKVRVVVNGISMEAPLDSGASRTLIKIEHCSEENIFNIGSSLRGLGTKSVHVIGATNVCIEIFHRNVFTECLVVPDDSMKYDIILGIDFLKANNFNIDLNGRKITMKDGKALITASLDDDYDVVNLKYDGIPVRCSSDMVIGANQMGRLPVEMCLPKAAYTNLGLIVGVVESSFNVLDGIINTELDDNKVCVTNRSNHNIKISKNQIIGEINALQTEEVEVNNENISIDTIKKEVVLDNNLSEIQKSKINEMLSTVAAVMNKCEDDIGIADVAPHEIEVVDDTPIWIKPRNFAPPINEEIEDQCKSLIMSDILEYSNSPYSAAVVPVKKPDGTLRLCIDYRKLNNVTLTEHYSMPNLLTSVYRAKNVKYFTKLDLIKGYHQILLHPESRHLTAFSTVNNQYQFKRSPFGLKNSGIAFQRVMNEILSPIMCSNIIVYIDDILITSTSFDEHLKLVSKVMNTLLESGIKIKTKKCEFFKETINFLGHVISSDGIQKSPEFVHKVINIDRPKTVHDLKKFLGLVNFQRKFIPKCSLIAQPLSKLTGAQKKLLLSGQTNAFMLLMN